MKKMILVAMLLLFAVMACGCMGSSKPVSIEIESVNLGEFDKRESIEEVSVISAEKLLTA